MRLPRWATIETRQKCCGWKGVEERDMMMSARASVAHRVRGASAAGRRGMNDDERVTI